MREYIYCFSIFSIFHKLIVFWKNLSIRTTRGQKTKLAPLEADKVLLFSFSFFVFPSLCHIPVIDRLSLSVMRGCVIALGGLGGLQGGSEVSRAVRERAEEESELRCMQIV